MAESKTKYRYTGDHAHEFAVGDKRVMTEPGGFVELTSKDLDDPGTADLLDTNLLIKAEEGGK